MSIAEELQGFCRDLDKRRSEVEAERWKRQNRKKKKKKEMPIDIKHTK